MGNKGNILWEHQEVSSKFKIHRALTLKEKEKSIDVIQRNNVWF